MDTDSLKLMLQQLQLSNQTFLANVVKENREFLERALRDGKSSSERQVAAVPNFRGFNKSSDKWSTYLLQLDQHFVANGVTDEQTKRASILSWIGADSLELLQKLFDGKVKEKTFKEIITTLSEHFIEKQHVLAARFKFYRTTMKSEQSYSDWVAELRGSANDCMFRCSKLGCDESYVDSKIRDMIVIHTPHEKVRTAALQKTNPTLEEVLQIASIYETTVKTCTVMTEGESSVVNVITKSAAVKHRPNSRASSKWRGRSQSRGPPDSTLKSCPGCGVSHARTDCFHYKRKTKCNACTKSGHIASVCKLSSNRKSVTQQEHVNSIRKESFEKISVVDVVHSSGIVDKKILVKLNVNGKLLDFQVDTGATCSLVGAVGYKQLGEPLCIPTNKTLRAYGGHQLPIKGTAMVTVSCDDIDKVLPLIVVESENASNILGLDWFKTFNFHVKIPQNFEYNHCFFSSTGQASNNNLISSLANLTNEFPVIFENVLGLCMTFKADIALKRDAKPKFCKPYNLPFAQYDAVRAEINRLESKKVLKPINSSEWAAPIVVVKKPNGTLRICADFKVGLNSQIEIDRYPIPRIEELFHKLQGGQYFTKIDLSEAYLQIELSEESKKFMVINTPFGLFQFQRLPFGVASAPGIFQRFMEELVAGVPGCAVYLDDVIITGKNEEEHKANVREIFERLKRNGLKCRKDKCVFANEQIEYVGHIIDSKGIKPSTKRLEAIKLMPRPRNVREVEAFIGKINYYNKFIQNFSSKASALNLLRRQQVKFEWGPKQDAAFNALKNDIVKAAQLVHYDDKLPIILATDASKYGIGAVISHKYPDGTEKPISFASKTLNESQLNYSQVEKEGLSIIFGVTRFHQYLYGRRFELTTDHQALTTIFHPQKKLPVMTLHRLQRWAILLQAYDYTIRYKNTTQHANADALSRLPIGEDLEFDREESSLLNVNEVYESTISVFPISATLVAQQTEQSSDLKFVKKMIEDGWLTSLPNSKGNLKPFFDRRLSLSLQSGVILLHTDYTRVVIPKTLQQRVLSMLHEGHWGKSRMKQMARRYVWFPKIDEAIEAMCSSCSICSSMACGPKRQFSPWPESKQPWERIHLDFAGPFFGSMWLIVVDSYSKFPYTLELSTITSSATISSLQKIFAIEGLPQTIVSDNGTQFTSGEFRQFCELNLIEHLTSAPFHPASNGLAERFVRTFKESFTKAMKEGVSKELALCKYLATYRSTPNPLIGKSPAEMLHGRQPRTLLSALRPESHPKAPYNPKFNVGQKVQARNFSGKHRWISGTISHVMGRMMYAITTNRGPIRRHQNQIRKLVQQPDIETTTINDDWELVPGSPKQAIRTQQESDCMSTLPYKLSSPAPVESSDSQSSTSIVRRSERPRKQTVRFQVLPK